MNKNQEKWVLRVFFTFVFAYGAVSSQKPGTIQSLMFGKSNTVAQASQPLDDNESGRESPYPTREGMSEPLCVVFQTNLVFNGGGPVCFTNQDVEVTTIMLATKAAATNLATLIDAPETARIRVAQDGWLTPPMTAMEQSVTEQIKPEGEWRIIEIDFEVPVLLSSLTFGDSGVRSEWLRYWRGEVKGIVAFNTPPSQDVRKGVSSLLAIRGGFGGYTSTYAQRKAAVAAGLNYGVDWATLIILR